LNSTRSCDMPKVTFTADFANLDLIRDFVGEVAEQAGFSGKEVYAIQLAVDEACSNVIEHAYEGMPGGDVDISCEVHANQLTIVVHDHGKLFDMSQVRQPNLGKELGEREVGGLGVYLINKLMDEVHFVSSQETGNYLTMIKRKSGAP
jgi:anti-sigma regulatory factor (Ser/Thr protein kinase)